MTRTNLVIPVFAAICLGLAPLLVQAEGSAWGKSGEKAGRGVITK